MTRLAALWRRHKALLLLFLAAAGLTLFFAVRFSLFLLYWQDPAHRNQPLEGWMTIGYIAHSYHVPREALAEALNLAPQPGKRPTLEALARQKGMSLDDFERQIEETIARLRQEGAGR